jgi:hypothetical protein
MDEHREIVTSMEIDAGTRCEIQRIQGELDTPEKLNEIVSGNFQANDPDFLSGWNTLPFGSPSGCYAKLLSVVHDEASAPEIIGKTLVHLGLTCQGQTKYALFHISINRPKWNNLYAVFKPAFEALRSKGVVTEISFVNGYIEWEHNGSLKCREQKEPFCKIPDNISYGDVPDESAGNATWIVGRFDCSFNKLTCLCGAPASVGGDFDCSSNPLVTLQGCPSKIGGKIILDYRPNLRLLRTLVAKEVEFKNNENWPFSKKIEAVLNQFKGQGKRGLLVATSALLKLEKELQKEDPSINIRENIKW